MDELEKELRKIVSSVAKIPPDGFSVQDDLVTKFGVDSMQRIEMVIEMEKKFDITIPDDEASRLRSLLDFVNLIQKRKAVHK